MLIFSLLLFYNLMEHGTEMILINKSETLSGLFFALIAVLVVIGLLFPTITKASENNVQAGELIITEIMQDPDELSDTNGEWFELYNTTTTPFDLNGCILRDNGSNSHTILGTVIVAPMSYAVLAVNAAALTTVSAAYDYSSFTLTNTDDEIIIECGGVEIDRVEYSSALGFPSPTGASMQLNDLSLDNNVGANWSVSTATWSGSTDKGTPGMANAIVVNPTPDPNATAIPTPSPTIAPTALPTIVPGTGVQITEIMADPAELSDTYGEWFEVYNPSSTDFDLNGCKIHDNGSNSHTIADSVIVPPMGYAVLAANAISLTTVTVAYDYASFTLSNSNDAIIIECNGMEIDRVEYDTALGFPTVTSGASMQLNRLTADNKIGANWSTSTETWAGSTDMGTPAMSNNTQVGLPSAVALGSQKSNNFASTLLIATVTLLGMSSALLAQRKQR